MEITYELSQRDFFDALVAHRNRSWTFRLAAVVAVIFLGVAVLVVGGHRYLWPTWQPLFLLIGIWVVLLYATPWWSSRRQFLKQPGAQGPRTVRVDNVGVHTQWNGGSASVEWKNSIRVVESKNEFLLYTSPAAFSVVPKRALNPERMSEFRELLSRNSLRSR